MNRREFLKEAAKLAGGGLAGYFALLRMGIPHAEAFEVTGSGIPATGGGQCTADSEVAPTYDVDNDSWTLSTGSDLYALVDDPRGSEDTDTYLTQLDSGSPGTDVVRHTMPGDCDISSVTVYVYGGYLGGACNLEVEISPDNSNWETAVSQALPDPAAEISFVFTSLSYSTPSYIYVRFASAGESTYNTEVVYNIAVVVNPS